MPTPSPKLGLALPSQPDDFSTADVRANWEKIDAAPGTFICTSTTRPTWGVNQAGRHIYETNTGVTRAWTGSTWRVEGYEPGDIKVSARSTPSDGWLACDGSTRNRSTYSHLFAAIGTAFNTGGEAATDFRLPDTRQRFIIGRHTTTGQAFSVLGEKLGSAMAVLLPANLPQHSHSMAHAHAMPHQHTMNHAHTMSHTHRMPHDHVMTHAHSMNHGHTASSGVAGGGYHEGVPTRVYDSDGWMLSTQPGGYYGRVFVDTYRMTPDHSHSVTVNNYNGATGTFTGNTQTFSGSTEGSSTPSTGTFTGATEAYTGNTQTFQGNTGDGPGSGAPFNIMPPSLTLNVFIKI